MPNLISLGPCLKGSVYPLGGILYKITFLWHFVKGDVYEGNIGNPFFGKI